MMQDVRELGYLICKKMVPPHGRTCRGRDGMNFLSLFFFFFCSRLTLMTNLCFGRRKPPVELEPCPCLQGSRVREQLAEFLLFPSNDSNIKYLKKETTSKL